MSEITLPMLPVSDADKYPCCDPATCAGCGCCTDHKKESASCC